MSGDRYGEVCEQLRRLPYLTYLALSGAVASAVLPACPEVDTEGRSLADRALEIIDEAVRAGDFQANRDDAYKHALRMRTYLVPTLPTDTEAPVTAVLSLLAELAGAFPLYEAGPSVVAMADFLTSPDLDGIYSWIEQSIRSTDPRAESVTVDITTLQRLVQTAHS